MPTIDLTTPPDDLWQRMRNGFSMPDLDSPLVADRQAWYLNRPDLLKRIFERSRRYLQHIVAELEKRDMPTELALLPIVESSFRIGDPKGFGGVWLTPGAAVNRRLWAGMRHDLQKGPPNSTPSTA